MNHLPEKQHDPFFKLLFEASPHPYLILRTDAVFTIMAVNDRYLSATGTQRDAIIGHGLFEIFPDNPNDKSVSGVGDLHMSLNRVVSDRKLDTMGVQKYDIPRRDGGDGFEVKYWSPVNTPVFADDGSVAYIIHHVEDVTEFILGRERANLEKVEQLGKIEAHAERMEAEVMRRSSEVKDANRALKIAMQKLEQREVELAAANRAKDSFLATMSHEIRTPLTGMLGMLELLSMTQLDMEQRTTLDTAWDSGRGLLRIVSDILDWSKIEEGKLELSLRPTSIPQLLQEVVNTYSRVASAKNLILYRRVDPRISAAHIVDPLRLSQVLNNFVSNAIKFTQYGEIELSAELIEQLDSGERIRFSVKDTGIGIAKEVQEHLFQRYRQESADTARMYGGTGLGLAICRRLSEMMDGQIGLRSEPGLGSIFSITLTLPVSGVPGEIVQNIHPEVKHREVSPLFTDSLNAPLVLAVDDHPTNRDLLARQIKLLGLQSETAENGQMALSMWRDGSYALVITDCHMPNMDGYVLSQEIRRIEAEEARSRIPIIAWTANAQAVEAERCKHAGMDDLLVKPANLAQLKKTLAKWLSVIGTDGVINPSSPHATNSGRTEPVDFSVLNMVVTDREDQIQVLRDFQSHIRADSGKLMEMLQQGDLARVESTAHRMKGSSRMVGAHYLATASATIEQAARDFDMAGASAAKRSLDDAIRQLEVFLDPLMTTENPRSHDEDQ
ncbi:virulence sensor protein BvgS [Sideroxyarcus emersonii]|uniref:Virulence sensor protein BvgS n=1 Tax=Sideroxyarcus emersonii TaxID=2764705 RepID=A0AAN1XAK4_9PROT|nr:ATP-binding protein [Sideroxyarcus emersonii]BCK87558.1 virulence sensor protein BvgS [Sideroxyarcus emersonii]